MAGRHLLACGSTQRNVSVAGDCFFLWSGRFPGSSVIVGSDFCNFGNTEESALSAGKLNQYQLT
jgi:hypothetical protein